MDKGINVLSLFDGISGAQVALQKLGIKVNNYYASEIDKHTISVTMKNFPDTIQLGDVTKWREWNLPKIDLLIGGSPCFVAGTKVLTEGGLKNIEDVKVGDMVLTHENRYRKVLRVGGKMSETVKLVSSGTLITETTKEHPYYVRELCGNGYGGEGGLSRPSWVKVCDLIPDVHYVGVPINMEACENGHTSESIYTLASNIRGHQTNIPYEFVDLNNELLQSFLDGYNSNDGVIDNDFMSVHAKDESDALTLGLIVNKLYNVPVSYNSHQCIGGKKSYSVMYRRQNYKDFVSDDIVWQPMREVYETGDEKWVYNLEVEEDNSYTANNAIVHNCQGFSMAGKKLNFQDPRSKLFFEYVDILKHFKPEHFFLENVKMKQSFQAVITSFLGVEPVEINSGLLSAQSRPRLYWCDWDVMVPKQRGVVLDDILDPNANHNRKTFNPIQPTPKPSRNGLICRRTDLPTNYDYGKRVYLSKGKSPTLCAASAGSVKISDDDYQTYRNLSELEGERLQTYPDNYTDTITRSQRFKALGNSFTVDVIAHILSQM